MLAQRSNLYHFLSCVLPPVPAPSIPLYDSYITLDIAENDTGERVVRIVYNGKEAVLPGAETPWIPLSELQKR